MYDELCELLKYCSESRQIMEYFYKYEWSWRTKSRRHSFKIQWQPSENQEMTGDTDVYTFWERDTLIELLSEIKNSGHISG